MALKKQSKLVEAKPIVKKEDVQFDIHMLRMDQMIYGVQGVLVCVFCLMLASFLPELISRYLSVYNVQALQDPQTIQTVQTVTASIFAFGLIFAMYVLIGNIVRLQKVRALEKELKSMK